MENKKIELMKALIDECEREIGAYISFEGHEKSDAYVQQRIEQIQALWEQIDEILADEPDQE